MLIAVQSVTVERYEGDLPLPDPVTHAGPDAFDKASATLAGWAVTAPAAGEGYHKCGVTVAWRNGVTYYYRHDLQSLTGRAIDVGGEVRRRLEYTTRRPWSEMHVKREAHRLLGTLEFSGP